MSNTRAIGRINIKNNKNTMMNFSEALIEVNKGKKITRAMWNGKNMFVFKVNGSEFIVNREPLVSIFPEGTTITYRPHLDMKAVDGTISVWTPSSTDIFSEDWFVV